VAVLAVVLAARLAVVPVAVLAELRLRAPR
jgi:hypothetical protein